MIFARVFVTLERIEFLQSLFSLHKRFGSRFLRARKKFEICISSAMFIYREWRALLYNIDIILAASFAVITISCVIGEYNFNWGNVILIEEERRIF